MRSHKVKIDGFTFGLNYGDAFGVDGIVVPMTTAANSAGDRIFQDALKKAARVYAAFRACCSTYEFLHSPKSLSEYTNTELEIAIKYAQRAIEQKYFQTSQFEIKRPERAIEIATQELQRRQLKKKPTFNFGNRRAGYVYLLRSSTGYYKIGRTADPDDRIKTFGVKLPFEVEYDCLIKADDMHELEHILHDRYADRRVNGEWFVLTDDDVEFIRGLAS